MKRLLRYLAAAILAMSLTTGIVRAASIDETGPWSENEISFEDNSDVDVDNDNDVVLNATANQGATSGDAKVKKNTTGGDATTGDADNSASLSADVEVDNTGCGCPNGNDGSWLEDASIDLTGPYSKNEIEHEDNSNFNLTNNNTVTVNFTANQGATSGDATVYGNTTGGDATTGDASNSFDGDVSVSISN